MLHVVSIEIKIRNLSSLVPVTFALRVELIRHACSTGSVDFDTPEQAAIVLKALEVDPEVCTWTVAMA